MMIAVSCEEEAEVPQYQSYDEYPVYEGKDLGLTYSPEQSIFRLWAPTASTVKLHFYEQALEGTPSKTTRMESSENGTWLATFDEDLQGMYYTFQTKINGEWQLEVPGPYAKAVGTNGLRAQVIDLSTTNPEGWETTLRPRLKTPNDIIIYELHVRDLSMHPNSGIQHKGKYLGLTELNTVSPEGALTGLSHIKDLGATHVHLLPSFDYLSVDESKLNDPQFNWGYDPQNYNVPEGSYATNPEDGAVRVREFKQMVQALHANGLRVIMDVVYNHTGDTETSVFNQVVPAYYYRHNKDGSFSNASGCGNETASERAMMRKFIVESVTYWAEEYKVDGFRFDLMGIHDIETMNQVSQALKAIDPSIFVYGEGWTAGDSPLPEEDRAIKAHTFRLEGVAAFSDDIRDGLKGSVFEHEQKGFVSGEPGREEDVKFGIVASTDHPQVDIHRVSYADGPWAKEPSQTISYVSCHDNHTLWDRLAISNKEDSEEERIKMHMLALTSILTSQGISFLHAGVEMLRTKGGEENSYKSPDGVNQLDWSRKAEYHKVYEYTRLLIALRKIHPAFRMPTTEMIKNHLEFIPQEEEGLIVYSIKDHANLDEWKNILVVLNGNGDAQKVKIPAGTWTIAVNEGEVDETGLGTASGSNLTISGRNAMILYNNN